MIKTELILKTGELLILFQIYILFMTGIRPFVVQLQLAVDQVLSHNL